jgi:AcrR family transcriptional regulator
VHHDLIQLRVLGCEPHESTDAIGKAGSELWPQINYHFESKEALWVASVDYLFGLLGEALGGLFPARLTAIDLSLLESALIEFGAKGFDGASTRAIARPTD